MKYILFFILFISLSNQNLLSQTNPNMNDGVLIINRYHFCDLWLVLFQQDKSNCLNAPHPVSIILDEPGVFPVYPTSNDYEFSGGFIITLSHYLNGSPVGCGPSNLVKNPNTVSSGCTDCQPVSFGSSSLTFSTCGFLCNNQPDVLFNWSDCVDTQSYYSGFDLTNVTSSIFITVSP